MEFKGVAQNPPRRDGKRDHAADMSRAEISCTQLGDSHLPVLIEHDREGGAVGVVTSSWKGIDGSLRVSGRISDSKAQAAVRDGSMRGLSLGTGVTTDGINTLRTHDELSLCETPRRPGCYISEIDNQVVREVHCFAESMPLPSQPPLATPPLIRPTS